MKKRALSFLVALCLVFSFVPSTAFAEGEGNTDTGQSIQLGASGISGYDSTTGYDYIYFGNWTAPDEHTTTGPIKWRVLEDKTNTGESGLFLLSDALLGTYADGGVYFANTAPYSNAWQGSAAQSWCNSFYTTNLTSQEQGAVLATSKSDEAFTSSSRGVQFAASENILSDDKVFFLSAKEAENGDYGFTNDAARIANYGNSAGGWWLRSSCADSTYNAGRVIRAGLVDYYYVHVDWAARPAFNLNPDSVLFASAATGGKADTAVDENLTAVTDYGGSEWKLTLKDSSRSFSANVNGRTSVAALSGGNVQITYSSAQAGSNEYVSVMLCDSNDNVLYYGNIAQSSASGTESVTIPAGLAPGSYTLKVFSEQCNGDEKTDYASAFQNIDLKNVVLLQEATPNAVFTATNDNCGTLSGADTSMKYSVDGGMNWNNITGEAMEITGVTAEKGVKVCKPGDGTTTADSEVQTIDITQSAQPTGIDKADCTTSQQNNGQITGVDTTMEYKLSTDSDWTTITTDPVTGLTDGTYEVRVKANGTVLASTAVTVTIGAHTCVAQGDWQYDGTDHWKLCVCGAKIEKTTHSGGTATCRDKAKCEICGESYGELNANNHSNVKHIDAKAATRTAEGNIEYWYCSDCKKYYKDAAATKEIAEADTVTAKLLKANDRDKSPQTGDNSNLTLWIALLLASGGLLTVIVINGVHTGWKRRNRHE